MRVQVPELGPPDPIRPTPLKRDIYKGPPPLARDDNLGKLADALGFFNRNLQGALASREAQMKEDETARRSAEYEAWRASTSNADQVAAIREGRVPWYADPYIGAAVRKDYGAMEAMALGQEIEQEIAAGNVPLHQTDFNIERFILEKANDRVERLSSSYEAIGSFRRGLDALRENLTARHQKLRGEAATAAIEDITTRTLSAALDNAVSNGLTGDILMDQMRKIYKELGPRQSGGSLDLQYGRIDEILLDILDKRAADPKMSGAIIDLLNADRLDVGNGTRLGPLRGVARHMDKTSAIERKVLNTQATVAEAQAKATALQAAKENLKKQDGSFSTIVDAKGPNPVDPTKEISIPATALKEEAVNQSINEIRQANGGQMNFAAEADLVINNGVKHPQWIPFLDSAYRGFLNSTLNSKEGAGPEQMSAIVEAGQLFNMIADKNPAYAREMLDGKTREFFETYTALTRIGKMSPTEAAMATARAYSQESLMNDPLVAARRGQEIEAAVRNIDTSWMPFSGGIKNNYLVERQMIELTTAYTRAGGISIDDAVALAKERISKDLFTVNGHAVLGQPGIAPTDGPYFEKILGKVYEKNKDWLYAKGIDDPTDLTVVSNRNGVFYIADAKNGFPIAMPDGDPGKPETYRESPMKITFSDIAKIRKTDLDTQTKQTIEKVMEKRRNPTSYAPHNLLRGLFGYEPTGE